MIASNASEVRFLFVLFGKELRTLPYIELCLFFFLFFLWSPIFIGVDIFFQKILVDRLILILSFFFSGIP